MDDLRTLGWSVSRADYRAESFGNILIDLSKGSAWLRLTRDRGELMIDGPDHGVLRAADLFRAFHDPVEFRAAVAVWLQRAAG